MGDSLPVVDLGRDERAIAVAAGFFHTCAILHAGDVKCWGELLLYCCGVILLVYVPVIFTPDFDAGVVLNNIKDRAV